MRLTGKEGKPRRAPGNQCRGVNWKYLTDLRQACRHLCESPRSRRSCLSQHRGKFGAKSRQVWEENQIGFGGLVSPVQGQAVSVSNRSCSTSRSLGDIFSARLLVTWRRIYSALTVLPVSAGILLSSNKRFEASVVPFSAASCMLTRIFIDSARFLRGAKRLPARVGFNF